MDGTRPLMLGLVGNSASGKTTLVRGVVRLLGHNGVTPVCLDDYHRYSRADLRALGLTHADPAANNLDLMAEHLATLRAGGTINKPLYDQRTGTLRDPEVVAATGLVIAYGMLTLTPPPLAGLFDLTVYLEPDQAMRQTWRLARDVRERGYTPEEFMALRDIRERDAARFIAVQRPLADLVVRFHSAPGGISAELLLRRDRDLGPLAPALDALAAAPPPGLALDRAIIDDDGHPADRFVIGPAITPEAAA
ncbi:MAG: uridine kinase, partial [Chloroflexales bacterium]|nr:uridine kinase [Chloroflexales bacterium]